MNNLYWHCDNYASSSECYTVASSTASTTQFVTYNDWIFVNAVIIFLVSFIFIGLLFSPLNKKRKYGSVY